MAKEGETRQRILQMDLLEAVIGLGAKPYLRHRLRRLHSCLSPAEEKERKKLRCSFLVHPVNFKN
jgi:hypothetical protein